METLNNRIRDFLIDRVGDHPRDLVSLATEEFGVTRQAVHRHLSKLIKEGVIEAKGTTRNKEYSLVKNRFMDAIRLENTLQEDMIWRSFAQPRLDNLPENVFNICYHGFTEILNNAIDHSEGTEVKIVIDRTAKAVEIAILDNGVGIFAKIKNRFALQDKRHAILELAKGKLTTDPSRHSGQGIFFTSRMFDRFAIFSDEISYIHDRHEIDWLDDRTGQILPGTAVFMSIAVQSTLTAKEVFDQFSDLESEDYGFSKTIVPLRLARYGTENLVSRSQAKRVLAGFDRFKEVVLDFANVNEIGQAFADEIFRVFARSHPTIVLLPVNASEDVMRMIRRAQSALEAERRDPSTPT